jgi:hypothetical protein
MEQEYNPRTSAAPGGISPCREYASATLGEGGGLYRNGAVRLTENHAHACTDLNYDQGVSAIWVVGSRERNLLGG